MARKPRPKKRNICPINVAWELLERGLLRVDFETSEVYRWHPTHRRWLRIKFDTTDDRDWQGVQCTGGYQHAKLRITIDGMYYRQDCFLHRIVWMARNNEFLSPTDQVDHGPQGKSCNHWSNLEKVTPKENSARRDQANAEFAAAGEVPF